MSKSINLNCLWQGVLDKNAQTKECNDYSEKSLKPLETLYISVEEDADQASVCYKYNPLHPSTMHFLQVKYLTNLTC